MLKLPGKNFAPAGGFSGSDESLGWRQEIIERLVMNDKQPKEQPDYGVRLTGDELTEYQQKFQSQSSGAHNASEYGPQGLHPPAPSEYGPQGGAQPPANGHYPGYQAPGPQQPGYQQPGYGQPGFQQPGAPYGQPFGGPQLHPDMAKEPTRPKSVNTSFWSILVAGVAYMLSILVTVPLPNRGMGDQDIALLESVLGPMLSEGPFPSVEAYLNSPMMTAAMIGQAVIVYVIYVLVALGIRHGWRSTRIIGTIFAVLSLFSLSFVTPLSGAFSAVAVVLGIVGIVFAWLPTSTEYFRRKAWQKTAKRAYPDAPSR